MQSCNPLKCLNLELSLYQSMYIQGGREKLQQKMFEYETRTQNLSINRDKQGNSTNYTNKHE